MAIHIGKFSGHEGDNNFIGVSKSGLEAIRGIITGYEGEVEGILDKMVTDVSQDNAFKGEELRKAVTGFVTAVKDEGKEWASQINRYCATIDSILNQMKTAESQLASGLDTSTHSVSAQTEKYNYGNGSSSAS